MNKIEKMQFLTDRMKDEKMFIINGVKHKFITDKLYSINFLSQEAEYSYALLNNILPTNLSLVPTHTFTDDEKIILKNLPFDYLARTKEGNLYCSENKPYKAYTHWECHNKRIGIFAFNHLYPTIQWENDEPVDRRDYV